MTVGAEAKRVSLCFAIRGCSKSSGCDKMKALIRFLKKLSGRMFYRIFFTYSTIILFSMAALFFILSTFYTDFIIQREIDRHKTVMKDIESEIQRKHFFVTQGVRQLYLEKDLIEDLAFALQHDYQEYLGYRLDKYYQSDSFVPYNFDVFIRNYFSRDSDVIAAVVRNDIYETEYEYLYNHGLWSKRAYMESGPGLEDDHYFKDFYVVRQQINDPISLDRLGTIDVYFSYDSINQLLSLRDNPIESSFMLFDENMNEYYSFGPEQEEVKNSLSYNAIQEGYAEIDQYFVQGFVDPESGLMITSAIPKYEITQLSSYRFTIFIIILLLSLFSIVLPYISLKSYSKRVKQIEEKMVEVQNGDLAVRIHTSRVDDDLNTISRTFNETLDRLNDYINKVYFSKLKQKEAELANLQAQINPHFLYNTLETIRMKSLAEGGKTTAKMIVQLSNIFRHSLQTAELVTIQNEQDHAYQYLELFKIRFPDQLTSEFHIEEQVRSAYVPPFILQPLIENYLLHGLKRDRLDNRIVVAIFKKRNRLYIALEDNGKGVEQSELERIQQRLKNVKSSSDSIGLGNVNQRIKLKFGDKYGITIDSDAGNYTKVLVTLPLISEV